MENRKFVKILTPAIVISLGFLVITQNAFAYGIETHAALTANIFEYYNKNFPQNKIPDEMKNYLVDGSRHEDSLPRWMNHFYDPVYDRGLESIYGAGYKSKEWAVDKNKQNEPRYKITTAIASILTAIQQRKISAVTVETDFTWERAIRFWVNGDKEKAMFILGHILHLIEDASVPDHTRNDAHPGFAEDYSPYENYAKKPEIYNADLLENLENKQPAIYSELEDYFNDIAKYSNNNFYSKGTIGLGKYKSPQPISYLRIGRYLYAAANDDKFGQYLLSRQSVPDILFVPKNDITIEPELIMQDYWRLLSAQSIRYGAGVIDLFFKEVEKAKNDPNFSKEEQKSFFARVIEAVKNIFAEDESGVIVENIDLTPEELEAKIEENTKALLKDDSPETARQADEQEVQKKAEEVVKSVVDNIKKQESETENTNQQIQPQINDKLLINEIKVSGGEFVEIYNPTASEVPLGGYYFAYYSPSKTDWGDPYRNQPLPENAKISAGGYYAIAFGGFSGASDWQPYSSDQLGNNGGTVAIWAGNPKESGSVKIDAFGWGNAALYYGAAFNSSFTDFASAIRHPKAQNQKNNTGDFKLSYTVTPGAENIFNLPVTSGGSSNESQQQESEQQEQQGGAEDESPVPTPKILINEIQIAGATSNDEFIELYNPNSETVDISSWSIQYRGSNAQSFSKKNFVSGHSIAPGEYFLIAHNDFNPDIAADMRHVSFALSGAGGTIFLVSDTTALSNGDEISIVDKVAYGSGEHLFPEDKVFTPAPAVDQSIQRKNFQDTDNNFADFELRDCPSPKAQEADCSQPATAAYDSTQMTINLSWDSVLPTLSYYAVYTINSPAIFFATTTATSFSYPINEIGRDYNFEIRAVDEFGGETATTSAQINAPSFLDNVYFFKDPRIENNEYFLDLRWSEPTFIKATPFNSSEDVWRVLVFYFNQDADKIPFFWTGTQYADLAEDDPIRSYGEWGTTIKNAVRLEYFNCSNEYSGGTALLLPGSSTACSSSPGGVRNSAYHFSKIGKNNLALKAAPESFGVEPTTDDFVTAAFYVYVGFNMQILVAVDKAKYFFREDASHQSPPEMQGELNLSFDGMEGTISAGWDAALDKDSLLNSLTYQVNFTPGGSAELDEQLWENLGTNRSRTVSTGLGDSFLIGARAVDDFGNFSEPLVSQWNFPENFNLSDYGVKFDTEVYIHCPGPGGCSGDISPAIDYDSETMLIDKISFNARTSISMNHCENRNIKMLIFDDNDVEIVRTDEVYGPCDSTQIYSRSFDFSENPIEMRSGFKIRFMNSGSIWKDVTYTFSDLKLYRVRE